MATRGQRGTFWQREEVLAMLDIAERSGHAEQLMSSTHLNTRQTYEAIARRLQRRGFDRTAAQCRSKFKRLRCNFMASLQAWGGIPRASGRTLYHDAMLRLWELAGRPRWEDRHHDFDTRPQGAGEQPGPPIEEEEQEDDPERKGPQLDVEEQEGGGSPKVAQAEEAEPAGAAEAAEEAAANASHAAAASLYKDSLQAPPTTLVTRSSLACAELRSIEIGKGSFQSRHFRSPFDARDLQVKRRRQEREGRGISSVDLDVFGAQMQTEEPGDIERSPQ
ncbi:uncharacterized protein LOC132585249 [Heteronotia binoei]|uniref:uncharacterized protein LOC132585249 n=1 Tax=Heteronotia binoei TaxID=13085 RepID=UPI00292E0486|nr:uncharacterized protein LOC132585249 [Heteronotia binoei]